MQSGGLGRVLSEEDSLSVRAWGPGRLLEEMVPPLGPKGRVEGSR